MKKNERKEWTEAESDRLKLEYPISIKIQLKDSFNRSSSSIQNKANKLHLKKDIVAKWSEDDIKYLIENYSNCRNEDLCNFLHKTHGELSHKIGMLGLSKSKSHRSGMIGKRNKMVGRDLSYENLSTIAKSFKTRGEFQWRDPSAYSVARQHGYLDSINEIRKYTNYSDFLKYSPACYSYIKRHKLEYLLVHLHRDKNVWDYVKICELIKNNKITTMYKLRKSHCGAYGYLKKHKLVDSCRKIMETIQ